MNQKVIHYPQYKNLFFALLLIAVTSVGIYVYGINVTVRNIVARQSIESTISTLTLASGEEEFSNIAMSNAIDLTKAEEMGFAPVDNQIFVSRTPKVAFADNALHN